MKLEELASRWISSDNFINDVMECGFEFGSIALLDLVQELGVFLTSTNADHRTRALQLISTVLTKHPGLLKDGDCSVLANFLFSRLQDDSSVPDALQCLLILVQTENSSCIDPASINNLAVEVMSRVFNDIAVQSLAQTSRNTVYSIILALLKNHLTILLQSENDFMAGFLSTIDGEKDPRNLMQCFKMFEFVAKTFRIGPIVEEFFDFPSCYFPITFRPPPDDPYGITASDLKQSLKACLCASPLFAELCLPLLMDKLSSSSEIAIIDSLDVMENSLFVFGVECFLPLFDQIFDTMTKKVKIGNDEVTLRYSTFLKSLFSILSDTKWESIRFGRLVFLYEKFIKELEDLESKNAKRFGKLVLALASSSSKNCKDIIDRFIPHLLESYTSIRNSLVLKRQIIQFFSDLIVVIAKDLTDSKLMESFNEWKSHLVSIFEINFSEKDTTTAIKNFAEEGLVTFVNSSLISPNESKKIIKKLIATNSTGLLKIAATFPDLVYDCFVEEKALFSFVNMGTMIKIPKMNNVFLNNLSYLNPAEIDTGYVNLIGLCLSELSQKPLVFDQVFSAIAVLKDQSPSWIKCFGELVRLQNVDEQLDTFQKHVGLESRSDILFTFVANAQPKALDQLTSLKHLMAEYFESARDLNCWQLDMISSYINKTKSHDYDLEKKINCILLDKANLELGSRIITGLITRSSPVGFQGLSNFLQLLNAEERQDIVIENLDYICSQHEFLTKKRHSDVKLLYQQRLFTVLISEICQSYGTSSNKKNFIRALGVVIKHACQKIILTQLDPMLPLLFHALDLEFENEIKFAALEIMITVVDSSAEKIIPHLGYLAKALLKLCSKSNKQEGNGVKVRSSALKCLGICAIKIDPLVISPLRQEVLTSTYPCLDDPKRIVRVEAAECRNRWFLSQKSTKN